MSKARNYLKNTLAPMAKSPYKILFAGDSLEAWCQDKEKVPQHAYVGIWVRVEHRQL